MMRKTPQPTGLEGLIDRFVDSLKMKFYLLNFLHSIYINAFFQIGKIFESR